MSLYSLKSSTSGFIITKFDEDLNMRSVYNLIASAKPPFVYTCDCPAGVRPNCRHRTMLTRMLSHVNDGWFYDYEHQNWHRPVGEPEIEGLDEGENEIAESSEPGQNGPASFEEAMMAAGEDLNAPISRPEPTIPKPLVTRR